MASIASIGVTVESVSRRKSSASGNPRFALHLTDGRTYVTAPDIMDAYAVSDHWRDMPVRLTLDGRSRITHIMPLPRMDAWMAESEAMRAQGGAR